MRLVLAAMPPPAALARWAHAPANATADPMPGALLDDREVAVAPKDPEAASRRALAALERYDVFRPGRLRSRVGTPDGRIAPGARIVQRIRLGPLRVEACVVVLDVMDRDTPEERAWGFSYATARGHPERGVARFLLRHDRRAGTVSFRISSWSMPGHWLTRLGRAYARRVQRRETERALRRMERLLSGH